MARCTTCHRRLLSNKSCIVHGATSAVETSIPTGTKPEWTAPLGALLGSGGFAAVWDVTGQDRVLKVAHAMHELSRARMTREAEALAAIGAPAAPRIYGHGVLPDGRAWIEMEKLAGANVAELIAGGVGLPNAPKLDAILAIASGTARVLERVHAVGFVHRDVKPDNLVRRPDGSIVVFDLGLARKVPVDPDDPTRAGIQVGSLEYMAPEQALDAAAVDARADLYALGCIVYELCAGRPPFVGDAAVLERAHAALRPPPLGALAAIPAELEALVHDLLAKQPDRRPATAREVIARLRSVVDTPTEHRQHSMSVIREGTQPVVLLWAELPRVDRTLLGMLAARKIQTVSQRGRKILGSVVGAEHTDPATAAIAAARDLVAAGSRVALHLEALAVVPKAGALVPSGPAIDRPEDWLPPVPWTGIALTTSIATVTQAPTKPLPEAPGFVVLAEAGESTRLFGRDALISDLVADAAVALAGSGPGFAVLLGDHGEGKTTLAAALAPRLAELGAHVIQTAIPPPGSGRPAHSALAELVGAPPPAAAFVRTVGDALRNASRTRPLAVVIDDLQLAEHELYDALEYATLGGEALPLWILGLALPRLDVRRPNLGSRAERHRRDRLQPLDEDSAVAMTAALLRPAEYPPLRALRQIAGLARGNPLHLATLAKEIHLRGGIGVRPNGEHFLDTTRLDTLPPIALGPWLAARELSALSVELAGLARICAVLGDEIEWPELAAVVDTVERAGGATTPIDPDVGLTELEGTGILARGEAEARWRFRQALLQEGIYATTHADERRAIHVAALAYWQQRDTASEFVAERIARHAEAAGERRTAAAAFATLGELASTAHRTLDADQAWQGALRNLDERDLARGRALLGRARARYKLQRIKEALVDLEEAIAIAVEQGDPTLEVEALLEQATALDWSDDYAGSSAAAVRARERYPATGLPALEVDVRLAEARSIWRAGELDRAASLLPSIVADAGAADRHETQIIAMLMAATLYVDAGQLDAALPAFDALVPLCELRDDRLHLGVAFTNRGWLWSARGDIDRCADDLRRVIQIAREIGQAALERAATYNLAESLLWHGDLTEAQQLAERSLTIQRAYGEGQDLWDKLLIARILAARGGGEPLARLLGDIEHYELQPADRVVVGVLHCAIADATIEAWTDALRAVGELGLDSRLELARLAAMRGRLEPALAAEVRDLARSHPVWRKSTAF